MKSAWWISAALAVCLALSAGPVQAQTFPNKDTAKRRDDVKMGTRNPKSMIYMGKDPATGDSVIDAIPPAKKEDKTKDPEIGPILIAPELKKKY